MTTTEMLNEIFDNLKSEIENDEVQCDKLNEALLRAKVDGAFREVKKARNYPKSYTEEMVEKDLTDYYSNIEAIARYDYNQIGAEGQTQYTADGVTIRYVDRDKLFAGVLPISR